MGLLVGMDIWGVSVLLVMFYFSVWVLKNMALCFIKSINIKI